MAGRLLRELTIRQLRALAAVQKHRSVTAAAKQLHLTQPAVTLQLRNLQALAGLPLIQRTGDGMLLTDAGREVLALADRIEAAIADCETTLEMMAGKTAGRISIGAVSTAKYFVPFMISGFSKLYPNIDVTLSIGNRQEIGIALRGYDLDFAIMGRPPADIDMNVHLIGDHPHVIIAPTAHRLARKSRIAPSELASETFLTREPGSGTRGLMEQLFETAGIRPKIGMAMSSNETIKQAVIAGLGIAFISAHTVATELDERRLVTLDVDGLPVVRQWFVLSRKDKVLLPPAQAMLDFLSARGKQFLPRTARPAAPHPAVGPRQGRLMRLAGGASASLLDRPRLFDTDMSNIPVKPYSGTAWAEREFAISRRDAPEPCLNDPPPRMRGRRERRVPSAPAARVQKNAHGSHHRYSGISRRSLRNGFTAYAALSLATNSSCHHRRRIEWRSSPVEPISPPPT